MSETLEREERLARLRSRMASAHQQAGLSVGDLARALGAPREAVADWIRGREEIPVSALWRLADLTGRPVWWFFGEQPEGITVEEAESAVRNLARARFALEALEAQLGPLAAARPAEPLPSPTVAGDVVDLSFYRERARRILERKAESEEERQAIDEGSIEMVAIGLFEAERGSDG